MKTRQPATRSSTRSYVRPGAWRIGLDRRLHEQVFERAFGPAGADLATLWVIDGNRRARDFYAAMDWIQAQQRRDLQLAVDHCPSSATPAR